MAARHLAPLHRLRPARHLSLRRNGRRQHRVRSAGLRSPASPPSRRNRQPRFRRPEFREQVRHCRRRARHHAFRWTEAAHRHRPRRHSRPAHPHPRRFPLQRRHPDRRTHPYPPARHHARPYHHLDFAPHLHRAGRRPDHRAARRPHHRARHPRRTPCSRRLLRGFVREAIAGRRARTRMSNVHEEEALGKAYDARLMRRLMQYLHPYRWRVVLAMALVAVVTPLELAPPRIFQVAIDRYFSPALRGNLPEASAWRSVIVLSVLYLLVLIFDFVAQYVQIRIMQRVGQQTMYDMRTGIFAHLQRLPMSYFDRNPVGRLVTRVTTDVDALNDLFAAGVVTMINDFFLLVTFVFRHYVRDANRHIRTAIAKINAFLQEYISGMSIVQIFNREQKARAEFAKRNHDNMIAWRDAILSYALFYPAVEILSVFAIALIYWAGGNRVLASTLTLGKLTAFTMYATRFFRPIQDLSEKFNILQSAMAASERIFKLLDEPANVSSPPDAIRLENPRGEIEFRNVWFSYRPIPNPGEDDWVLRDVSFRVEPGQTLAIVGHTGAGKTTLISLLLRFYDIQRGQILLDGIDIRKINLQDLRRLFGIVLQDPFLFTGTIESNVRLGTPDIDRDT